MSINLESSNLALRDILSFTMHETCYINKFGLIRFNRRLKSIARRALLKLGGRVWSPVLSHFAGKGCRSRRERRRSIKSIRRDFIRAFADLTLELCLAQSVDLSLGRDDFNKSANHAKGLILDKMFDNKRGDICEYLKCLSKKWGLLSADEADLWDELRCDLGKWDVKLDLSIAVD